MGILQRMEAVAARRRLSPRTVEWYQSWVRQFLAFHREGGGRWRHPRELRGHDVAAFLTDMANRRRLSASSQNQAMNGIVFLYGETLLCHASRKTTVLYTHAMNEPAAAVTSPMDGLAAVGPST